MKKVLTYISLLFSSILYSQDSLVFYSGFEENVQPVYTTYNISTFNSKWFSAWQSPDIYSTNHTNTANATPINFVGHQVPMQGDSYGGFYTQGINEGDNKREWFGANLKDSLIAGQTYCIKFNISLADTLHFATDNIGVYFSSDSMYFIIPVPPTPFPINYDYVISTPHGVIYNNPDVWTKIELQYTAKGDEKYLYIGNFYPDSLTQFQHVDNSNESFGIAYYYIDEVFIYKCDPLSITEDKISSITIYPNPAQELVNLTLPPGLNKAQLSVYNMTGQLLMQQQVVSSTQNISLSNLSPGMYVFVVESGDKVWRELVVKE